MSLSLGNNEGTCDPPDDMTTTLSASVELDIPAPHAPKCACCASLEDALMVIASLSSQLILAQREKPDPCMYGCTADTASPRCPNHGDPLLRSTED